MFKISRLLLFTFILVIFGQYTIADTTGNQAMGEKSICNKTALSESSKFIKFILDDLSKTYSAVGGGGIRGIKMTATNTYVVSISQEERIDKFTYELEMDEDCKIIIIHREETSVTPWQ
jgi:hypothetical protein